MLKVVIDTNVLVSALIKPDCVPELILSFYTAHAPYFQIAIEPSTQRRRARGERK
jgi:predicted nucleic acid-binding protein